jgi:outer membrane biosynthesis protein TonB
VVVQEQTTVAHSSEDKPHEKEVEPAEEEKHEKEHPKVEEHVKDEKQVKEEKEEVPSHSKEEHPKDEKTEVVEPKHERKTVLEVLKVTELDGDVQFKEYSMSLANKTVVAHSWTKAEPPKGNRNSILIEILIFSINSLLSRTSRSL